MDNLRRMHYVAEHYQHLQGLRLLPLGVAFLAFPLRHGFAPLGLSPRATVLVCLAVAVAASFPISRYYDRRFGHVEPRPWRTGAVTWITATLVFLTLVVLQAMRPVPVSLPLLFVSVALARLGVVAGRLRVHYLWIAAACAAFAILPVSELLPALRTSALEMLIGAGLVVAAIGDDRVLRRVMTVQTQRGRTAA